MFIQTYSQEVNVGWTRETIRRVGPETIAVVAKHSGSLGVYVQGGRFSLDLNTLCVDVCE